MQGGSIPIAIPAKRPSLLLSGRNLCFWFLQTTGEDSISLHPDLVSLGVVAVVVAAMAVVVGSHPQVEGVE